MNIHYLSVRRNTCHKAVHSACALVLGIALFGNVNADPLPVRNLKMPIQALTFDNGSISGRGQADPGIELPRADVQSLLNWAIHLSNDKGGTHIYDPPQVRFEPQAFFVDNACGGRQSCNVLGWYADRGVIHIHESLAEMRTLFARSLVVHELVHYFQHASGRFVAGDCNSFVERELEAYAVQQAFFVAYGAMPGIRIHLFDCPAAQTGGLLPVGR
jgi:hypothetical protein